MKKIFAFLVSVVLLVCCDHASPLEGHYPSKDNTGSKEQEKEPDTPAPAGKVYKILFIGNSLTLDATMLLPNLLNAAGITNVELYRTFHGAYTLPLYNENFYNAGICSFCSWKPGQARWRGTEERLFSPSDAVNAHDYDIVCLQEYSGDSPAWSWSDTEKSAYDGMISKIDAAHPGHKPEIVALFSHTFGTGMERLVAKFGNDNVKQFETCAATFRHVLEETRIERIISPAAVIQSLRTSGLNVDNGCDLTRGDQTHSDYGMSRFAEAAIIFKALITPLTGKKIEENPFRFTEYYPHKSLHTTPVTDENLPVILAAVEAAFAKPLEITDMSSYSLTPKYENIPGSVMLDNNDTPEDCNFPVVFPVGNGAIDSYKQPFWSGYGLWICPLQQQAFGKWVMASKPMAEFLQTRTFANDDKISSVAVRGIWTDDYFEFVIPVGKLDAGTEIQFKAPFYTRQGPVFWYFEWLDGGKWKRVTKEVRSWDGSFSCNCSFAIQLGTTYVSQTARFENPVSNGELRFRIRCADGAIQADSTSGSAVRRSEPNHTAADYSSVFYFYGAGTDGASLSFDIK